MFNEIDTVFHFSANADIRGGITDPKIDLEQNTIVTFNVLEQMRRGGVKNIVFASSAAVLGEPDIFPTPEYCAIPDQTSLYGASKMACESIISAYCEGFGFNATVFRFVSLLGPRYPHGHVFDFVKSILKDRSQLTILGDGTQRKSYLHISDCLNALLLLHDTGQNSSNFEVFNLGVSDYCTVHQSAEWICNEMKVRPRFNFTGGEKGWIGDNPFVFLDNKKAVSKGWMPTFKIEASVRITTNWLLKNKWIFK